MPAKYFNLILLLATGVLVYQVLLPMYTGEGSLYQPEKGYVALKASIASKEAALEQAKNIITQSKSIDKKFRDIDPEKVKMMAIMVPEYIDEVKLRSEITSILVKNNFSAEKLGFTNTGASTLFPGVYAYTITISVEDTSYENLKKFLALLERSMRILSVKSVAVTPAPKVGDMYKFDINIETYSINSSK